MNSKTRGANFVVVFILCCLFIGLAILYFCYSFYNEFESVGWKDPNFPIEIPKYGDISVVNRGNKIIDEMIITFMGKEYIVTGLPGEDSEYNQHIDTCMDGEFNVNVRIKFKDNTNLEKDLSVCIPSFYPHLILFVNDNDVKVSERIKAIEKIEPNSYGFSKLKL